MSDIELLPNMTFSDEPINATIATTCTVGSFVPMEDFTLMSPYITDKPNIMPIILGTDIPILDIVRMAYVLKIDFQQIREKYIELTDKQIHTALEYYENHKQEVDVFLKDLAPDLSIQNASLMAKRVIKDLPDDMIDADLGPGL